MCEIGPFDLDSIVTGDAAQLARELPAESVDLILTDPPYLTANASVWEALAGCAHALKCGGRLLTLCGHYQLPLAMRELGKELQYDWIIAYAGNARTAAMFQKRVWAGWKPCLVYRKGALSAATMNFARDLYRESNASFSEAKRHHAWGQGAGFFSYYIERWTQRGAVVLDPFVGGGTVAAVCRSLGRHYIGFEIDPQTAEAARERVRSAPMPLPFPQDAAAQGEFGMDSDVVSAH